ncbi:holin [Luteimonas saliphila]|uniref:holin n=1 Tax=Luteimonas saliphila TaxID=2804919 RepID=UPI00192E0959|nr:holin [Luteimonas saliphila]
MRDQIDATGVVVGKLSAYGGGASAIFFGLSASEFAAIVGAVVAVIGLAVQWVFNRRRDRREQAEHAARMRTYGIGK